MHRNAWLLLLLSASSVATIAGCNSPIPLDPDIPAEAKISRLVLDIDDFGHDPRELKLAVPRLFAPGCEPSDDDLPRYADYNYEGGSPVVKDDTATVIVRIKEAETGKLFGEFTWSMKRVREVKAVYKVTNGEPSKAEAAARAEKAAKGVWRLTNAPLPPKKDVVDS